MTEKLIYYRARRYDDIEALTKLLCELYEFDTYEELRLFDENRARFKDKKQAFFLAMDDKTPVGVCHGALRDEYVNGKEHDGTCGYLEAIYVKPTYRGQGIAATLAALCEDWARENGCREILSDCLLDNTESFDLHLRLGFVETERAVFFRKELI
ncbi:MAG: GNAT family N-acetyltransferase [Clostridiales bacterium]|jgi:aminoglycoside 6'-N-acetyltransferase I|nr:GNAT family N-acetyltransferase [Clostridiales bacterium]